jgi:hypothetical protein
MIAGGALFIVAPIVREVCEPFGRIVKNRFIGFAGNAE